MADGDVLIDARIRIDKSKQDLKTLKATINAEVKDMEKQFNDAGKAIANYTDKFNDTQAKLKQVNAQVDEMKSKMQGMSKSQVAEFKLSSGYSPELLKQQEKLQKEANSYKAEIEGAKRVQQELTTEIGRAKEKQVEVTNEIKNTSKKTKDVDDGIKKADKSMKTLSKSSKSTVKSMTSGFKDMAKYLLVFTGVESIFSLLTQSINQFFNSTDRQAQQLKADMDNLRVNIGNALIPAIQGVLNIFYKILAVVGAIVKAFSGINIFAKSTADATAETASNSEKQLASFDKVNKLSSSSSGGGGSDITPTDLSAMMKQYEELANKVKSIFEFILEPFKKAWETTGQEVMNSMSNAFNSIKGLIGEIGQSFTNIWSNGTVQKGAETILKIFARIMDIISTIADNWREAWANNNNGDKIVQNLANAFNSLLGIIEHVLTIINNILKSDFVQWLTNLAVLGVEKVTEALSFVLDKLEKFFGFLSGENQEKLDGWSIVLGSLAVAIGLVVTAITLYNTISAIATAVTTALGGAVALLTSPITLVVLAITALIAIIVLLAQNWDTISKALVDGWNWVKEQAQKIWNAIAEFFKTVFNTIGGVVKTAWNTIKSVITTVLNNLKSAISTVLNSIKSTWNNVWTNIKTVVVNVWNSIWGVIRSVINNILSGIENFVNGTIRGINWVLSGISKIANAVGSLIGLNPINLQLGTISLPRLAKGGIVNQPTQALIGEAGKEAVIPLENNTEWMEILADKIADKINLGQITVPVNIGGKEFMKQVIKLNRQYGFSTNGGGF